MGEVLPISNPLENISCRFVERRWMKSAKAWRCFIDIPSTDDLPSMLTGLIEDKVCIKIEGCASVDIAPAFVVDVPSKGKKFQLVIETVYEKQATFGPYLTALTDSQVKVTISRYIEETAPPKPYNSSPLQPHEIQGLHVGFFRNERFWDYLEQQSPTPIRVCSPEEAKAEFKKICRIESIKDLRREDFTAFVQGFNVWIREQRG